jgi:hypothetical protein
VAQWLKHCAKNRKVAGSNPDGVIGTFHSPDSFDPTLFDSACNKNEYQEYFLGVKAAVA